MHVYTLRINVIVYSQLYSYIEFVRRNCVVRFRFIFKWLKFKLCIKKKKKKTIKIPVFVIIVVVVVVVKKNFCKQRLARFENAIFFYFVVVIIP